MKDCKLQIRGGILLNNAFTLIELLAVIIILAIVALIATPIILNVIEDARISAGRSEASMIYSGINNYCATADMQNQLTGEVNICADGVTSDEVSQMVNLGNAKVEEVSYSNGKITNLVIESNNHKFTLCGDGSFAMDDEECSVTPPPTEQGESLISTLLEQVGKNGLVQDTTNTNIYYYTGTNEEVSNNYLWYGGHHWRVVEIDTNANTLLLISQQPLTAIQPASAGWETKEAYEASYINTWLNEYFYNSLDSSIQNSIISNTFNIGIYTDVDEITTSQKVGLLDETQYTRAGGTDSYLDIKDWWWLGNRYDSSNVRRVYSDGSMSYYSPANTGGARAVIKISNITITGGNGTLESNYEAGNKVTNTSDIQVGEYINVPYSGSDNACGDDNKCTFRVVSKDSDSIKVVLNGLLPTTSAYGDTTTITTSHTIYTPLNTFANNISSDYRYTGNKTFYIGDYSSHANYTDIQDETLSTSVGLPTVGEMFSGNDIDLGTSSTKTFVNVATIENPTVSSNYWTMNRHASSSVRRVHSGGTLGSDFPTNAYGARAVIYLKSGSSALTFTGGEGTAEQPYELSQ